MDEKRVRFIKTATRRTNVVLNKIRVLGNCANRSAYEYTDADADRIFNEIEKELKVNKMKFRLGRVGKKKEFKL